MQTDTPVYGTNKKARIAASEVSMHARTHKQTSGYFYKSCLMGKTRQRGDLGLSVERESTL